MQQMGVTTMEQIKKFLHGKLFGYYTIRIAFKSASIVQGIHTGLFYI